MLQDLRRRHASLPKALGAHLRAREGIQGGDECWPEPLARIGEVAERGFDPRTFGLRAQQASHCATPLFYARNLADTDPYAHKTA
eukprot:3435914-Karenia_brevis.AAC.1